MNLLYCCDSNFVGPTATSIQSFMDHVEESLVFKIYIFCDRIASEDFDALNLKIPKNVKIIKNIIPANFGNSFPTTKHLPVATYFRLYAIDCLREENNNLLFLDGDTMILDSLKELKNFQISADAVVAACPNSLKDATVSKSKNQEFYFNAGVLLIDPKKWAAFEISKKCFELIKFSGSTFENCDQDALNIILKGRVDFLDPKYNVLSKFFSQFSLYKKIGHTFKIIHFASNRKPWLGNDPHPFAPEYRRLFKAVNGQVGQLKNRDYVKYYYRLLKYYSLYYITRLLFTFTHTASPLEKR